MKLQLSRTSLLYRIFFKQNVSITNTCELIKKLIGNGNEKISKAFHELEDFFTKIGEYLTIGILFVFVYSYGFLFAKRVRKNNEEPGDYYISFKKWPKLCGKRIYPFFVIIAFYSITYWFELLSWPLPASAFMVLLVTIVLLVSLVSQLIKFFESGSPQVIKAMIISLFKNLCFEIKIVD